jgi:predicted GH43/DUF377 family glycosyl hydrolase
MIYYFLFLLVMSLSIEASHGLPFDLESAAQDFVLETKRIDIPGHPHAFNPSIIRWKGRILMSFRVIPDRKNSFNTEIGLVFLDEEFRPVGEPQLLSLRDEYSVAPCRAEDARLIVLNDKLYAVYDDNTERMISKGGFRVHVAEIYYDSEHFIVDQIECLSTFENESKNVREKAWVPFDYRGNLLLAYSIHPHRIFYPRLDGTGVCDTVACTKSEIGWKWGILHGGTPGFKEKEGYLAFFHSSIDMPTLHSNGEVISHYFMGAYLFSHDPPFHIFKISPEPIIGKNFYTGKRYKPYWKPVRCVFPCGYISDDKYIWITYGRDDHETWIVKLDKKGLLQSLTPCAMCNE